MSVKLMDCTLRDGGNVVGKGFSSEMTNMILEGLISSHVHFIEIGNSGGIGAYEVAGFTDAEKDQVYLDIAKKYLDKESEIGMFLNAKRFREKNVYLAKENGLSFLRVGADAGDANISLPAIKIIKNTGLKVFYALMKAYVLSPTELAEEAKKLENAGLDEITIMDSAGTMLPEEVATYTETLKKAVSIPIAFHCHNNLGLSAANAIVAYKHGIDILDCGLMGMARSAGNLATEVCVGIMQRYGEMRDIDLFSLLEFIDKRLMPAMAKQHYHNSITPLDLVLGISGCHSSFVKKIKLVAESNNVNVYKLIYNVSQKNKKNPSEELMNEIAQQLANQDK